MFTLVRDLRHLRHSLRLPRSRGSLAIRHCDAGSCNGCEHELTLASSPYYDLQRHGLGIVASPRHADVLLVTGVVTTRMHQALLTAYRAMPHPRRVAALGDCALGDWALGDRDLGDRDLGDRDLGVGQLAAPDHVIGAVDQVLPVDLTIPGCPPDPDTIARALLSLLPKP